VVASPDAVLNSPTAVLREPPAVANGPHTVPSVGLTIWPGPVQDADWA